jgi:hypothetical protein
MSKAPLIREWRLKISFKDLTVSLPLINWAIVGNRGWASQARQACLSGQTHLIPYILAFVSNTRVERLVFGVRRLDAAFLRRGLTRRAVGLSSQALLKRRQAAALQISAVRLSQYGQKFEH